MTEPNIDPKILGRINALIAQSESTPYPAESETFAAKAAEMMAAYGVTESLLAAAGSKDDPIESRGIRIRAPHFHAKVLLMSSIAQPLSCRVVHDRRSLAIIYGHRSDVDRVEYLFDLLLMQVQRMLADVEPMDGTTLSAYRRSWVLGFAARVMERMEAGRKIATDRAGTGAELVLVDRAAAVQKRIADELGEVPTGRARDINPEAMFRGYDAGRNADIGNHQIGATG